MKKQNDVQYQTCVRSKNCSGILQEVETMCVNCRQINRNLKRRLDRSKNKKKVIGTKTPLQRVSKSVLAKAVKIYRQKSVKLNKQLDLIKEKLEECHVKINEQMHTSLFDIIDKNNIDNNFLKLFWNQQKEAFSKGKGGHVWHPMMIRLAIMLHSQSSAAYRSLRDSGILKLPGESTLRDFTNFIKPKAGFHFDTLNELKQQATQIPEEEKWVTIIHDEMSIKSDLVFDRETGDVVGYINNPDLNGSLKQNVATHILVFMAVGVNNNLKATIGWFPTKTSTAHELYPIFWEAVCHLETLCNLKVIAATSDKAASNMRFFSLHGNEDLVWKTRNTFAPERYIYFFSDAPHLLKTARNNLAASGSNKNTRLLWKNGKTLLWQHISDVYKKDIQNELSRATKLTYNHIYLTSFSVMKVNLAVQVLSRSVGMLLEQYGGESAEETSKFVIMMDRFFDCLNSRCLYEAERKRKPDLAPYTSMDDPRFRFLLEEFIFYLNDWKEQVNRREGFRKSEKSRMFLTMQTYNGLVMTAQSLVAATRFLLSRGVKFVLSNKFCQDPIEEHFGRHRALGRRNSNPTVYEFGYQENKLRLQRELIHKFKPNLKRTKNQDSVSIDITPLKKKTFKEPN